MPQRQRLHHAQKFQVFVKNLAGKTVVVQGFTGMDEVSLVVSQVESLTGVPRSLFYLVGASGRRLREYVTLERHLCRALGRAITATWVGCWPSKNVCFRCLAPRPTHGPLFSSPTPARETQHLGRAPPVQRSGNSTFRKGTAPLPHPSTCFLGETRHDLDSQR